MISHGRNSFTYKAKIVVRSGLCIFFGDICGRSPENVGGMEVGGGRGLSLQRLCLKAAEGGSCSVKVTKDMTPIFFVFFVATSRSSTPPRGRR